MASISTGRFSDTANSRAFFVALYTAKISLPSTLVKIEISIRLNLGSVWNWFYIVEWRTSWNCSSVPRKIPDGCHSIGRPSDSNSITSVLFMYRGRDSVTVVAAEEKNWNMESHVFLFDFLFRFCLPLPGMMWFLDALASLELVMRLRTKGFYNFSWDIGSIAFKPQERKTQRQKDDKIIILAGGSENYFGRW